MEFETRSGNLEAEVIEYLRGSKARPVWMMLRALRARKKNLLAVLQVLMARGWVERSIGKNLCRGEKQYRRMPLYHYIGPEVIEATPEPLPRPEVHALRVPVTPPTVQQAPREMFLFAVGAAYRDADGQVRYW